MVEAERKGSPRWWWLDSHKKDKMNRSPWLQSTLSELDEKTKTMLKLIEGEADSFAKRVEMYYKKRPELIGMVEDSYRAHRSLAERYDQVKSEPGTHLLTALSSPLPFTKYRLGKSLSLNEEAYNSYCEAYGQDESDESEVDDPEEEENKQYQIESGSVEVPSSSCNEELIRLREELERLREENKFQQEQLRQKDEEKRDVIRQLSLAMDMLKEENLKLGQLVAEKNLKKESLLGRFFDGFTKS